MKANNATEKVILDYFEANASADLKKRVEAEKKTITGALKYCASQAQKQKVGNCACVDDATVFGWVMHYFEDEDAKKWESAPEKAKVKAGSAKKAIAAKKEAATGEKPNTAEAYGQTEANGYRSNDPKDVAAAKESMELAEKRRAELEKELASDTKTDGCGDGNCERAQLCAEPCEGCEDPAMVPPPPKRPPVLAVRPLSELPPIPKRERRERDAGQLFLFDAEGGAK